jgi:hypothetical protein
MFNWTILAVGEEYMRIPNSIGYCIILLHNVHIVYCINISHELLVQFYVQDICRVVPYKSADSMRFLTEEFQLKLQFLVIVQTAVHSAQNMLQLIKQ